MTTHSRPIPFTSLRGSRASRTRIFAASGSDPLFGRAVSRSTHPRALTSFARPALDRSAPKLWTPGLLDRLRAPLTRLHY